MLSGESEARCNRLMMTGLLSVLSLLPLQTVQQKKEEEDGGDEEEDGEGMGKPRGGDIATLAAGESSGLDVVTSER